MEPRMARSKVKAEATPRAMSPQRRIPKYQSVPNVNLNASKMAAH